MTTHNEVGKHQTVRIRNVAQVEKQCIASKYSYEPSTFDKPSMFGDRLSHPHTHTVLLGCLIVRQVFGVEVWGWGVEVVGLTSSDSQTPSGTVADVMIFPASPGQTMRQASPGINSHPARLYVIDVKTIPFVIVSL